MRDGFRAAAIQMSSSADKAQNVAQAIDLINRAADGGANFVVLPEVWTFMGAEADTRANAEPIDGETTQRLAELARKRGIWLHAGSMLELIPDDSRVYNTTAVINPDGDIVATYRKIHLYDVEIPGRVTARESDSVAPGDEIVTVDVGGVSVGLTICYDLRFPELFRELALRGAEVITVPAAFHLHTGKDHWEVLLRARAIENQVFVIAPGLVGMQPNGFHCYGRSMIIDPWGVVRANAGDEVGIAAANCDLEQLARIRRELPSLANRRPHAYRPAADALLAD